MSHFTVTVVLDGTIPADGINDALASALAKYDENQEVPQYIEHTRAELIAKGRKSFPAKLDWTDEQVYQDQIRYSEPDDIDADGSMLSTYNPHSKWDWWTIGGRWGGAWEVYPSVDTDGTGSMTQPSAFGMSPNAAEPKRVDVARKCDITPESLTPTFAVLTSRDEWIERGEMGWFGMAFNEKDGDEWAAQYAAILARESDNAWLVNVDCHI